MRKDSASAPNHDCLVEAPVATVTGSVPAFRVRTLAAAVSLMLAGCASDTLNSRLPSFEIPSNDPSFRSRVYAGAGFGGTSLDPDTDGTAFTADGSGSSGTQLRIGADVHNLVAFEIESAVLGEVDLAEADASVSYSTLSLNALVYGLNGVQMRSRREGWSAYGRLGFARVSESSNVLGLDEGGTSPVVGLGVEYGFASGLGVRGELTRYSDCLLYTSPSPRDRG